MDEPTGNLDPKTAESVMRLMHDVVFKDTGFVIVTHDPVIAESRIDSMSWPTVS